MPPNETQSPQEQEAPGMNTHVDVEEGAPHENLDVIPMEDDLGQEQQHVDDDLSDTGRSGSVSGDEKSVATNSSAEAGVEKTLSVVRIMVILVLFSLAAIASNVTFILVLNKEETVFQDHLEGYAFDLIQNLYSQLEHQYWVADSLSQEFINQAQSHEEEVWPFVTLPDFAQQCSGARQLGAASTIWFAPLVLQEEKQAWELYAQQTYQEEEYVDTYDPHHLHLHSSEEGPAFVQYRETSRTIDQGIFKIENEIAVDDTTTDSASSENEHYFPIWQVSSSNSTGFFHSTILFNQESELVRAQALGVMMDKQTSVMTKAFFNSTSTSIHESYASPTSALYFPILQEYSVMTDSNDESSSSSKKVVKGALTLEVDWESFFQNALYGFDESVVVVLENTCGQQYSYGVSGRFVEFLGEGDKHDDSFEAPSTNSSFRDFDDLGYLVVDENAHGEMEQDFDISMQDLMQDQDSNAEFVPSEGLCAYRILVYPSLAMNNRFLTNRPLYYQGVIALLFLFTTAIFILYDCMVEYRQKKMKDSAKINKDIVNSLFPKNVRDRVYANALSKQKKQYTDKGVKAMMAAMQTPKLRLKSFLSDATGGNMTSEPIADLFSYTSICFADIGGKKIHVITCISWCFGALSNLIILSCLYHPICFPLFGTGFTAWSSEREPSQVFGLLEVLFGAMDLIANRFKVFKVETVGDSYVAATGLPDPQQDHAIRMCRFAVTCLQKVRDLTNTLEASLGPGTGDLQLRFGIHSGPIIAGVLRGEKSRFQLFGDTMNTAGM
jgi:hypothetical protein